MPRRTTPTRNPWEDRFASPTPELLIASLDGPAAELLASLRRTLRADHDCIESLAWMGLPWRWTLSYRLPGARPDHDAAAHLVANPAAPTAVFRLSHEAFSDLPFRKLSRYVRDGLAQAKLVAGVSWPEWTVQSAANVSDLADLFRLLREHALAGA